MSDKISSRLRPILALEGLKIAGRELSQDSAEDVEFVVQAIRSNDLEGLFETVKDDENWPYTLDDIQGKLIRSGLDKTALKSFLVELEAKLWDYKKAEMNRKITSDPDKKFLGVLRDLFTVTVEPRDLKHIMFREYKNYVRLVNKGSDWIPEGNVLWRELPQWMRQNKIPFKDPQEARALFVDFLTRRAVGGPKRPPRPLPTPPLYD